MPARYTRTAIALHWLVALLLVGQFALGWYLEGIERGVPARGYFVNLHKSTGLLVGLAIVLRLGWRLAHRPPPLPHSMPRWQRQAASSTHFLLYVFMLLMPLSGYVASNFSKYGVNFFNILKLAPWGPEDKQLYAFFNQLHGISSWILLTLVLVHVLAALKHAVVDRDTLVYRMLPQRPPNP